MSPGLDRRLNRLYRRVGGALFLAACGILGYAAGERHGPIHWQGPEAILPFRLLPGQ